MDLFDLMTKGADPEDLALDRLETIVALYRSDDESVQDEALARAIGVCGKQWGGYKAGMEALARRREMADADSVEYALDCLLLREEAEDPGAMIRAARLRRAECRRGNDARAAVVARYGSLAAALAPTPLEEMFIAAAAHLADEDGAPDPWGGLAGWQFPWHAVPEALAEVVASACPLPETVTDARDEALAWDARKRELAVLTDGPGEPALPTACAARHRLVEDLWRRDLPLRNAAELEARLEYWAERGGDDGGGYAVLLEGVRALGHAALTPTGGEGTKDKAQRLRADNPSWSLARIGQELGISRQAVHKHLKPR